MLPHSRSPQGIVLPLCHREPPGKGQWNKGRPRAQPPRGHAYRHLQNHTCPPLHSCKDMEWEDVYKHMHIWGQEAWQGLRQDWCGSKGESQH